jgi:hypothetical protein
MDNKKTTLYIAQVKCTGGSFENEFFSSDPYTSVELAVQDLQIKMHENGATADWDHVQVDTFTHSSTITVSAKTVLPNPG